MKKVGITNKFFIYQESNKPCMTVGPTETLQFESEDCFHNLLDNENIVKSELLAKGVVINPSTGPVYVEGAMPGDTLKIHIDDIELLSDFGTMALIAEEFGALAKFIDKEQTVRVPIVDGVLHFFGGKLKLPVQPMVGVMAVTPKGAGIPTSTPGTHGGNMDCKYLTKGTTLYLPVAVEGALLGMGDVHALQGDGEVAAAVEVPGRITVTLELIKGRHEEWPVLETKDTWYVLTSALTTDEANVAAVGAMGDFLVKRGGGYSKEEWVMLLGVVGNLENCQIADPKLTARFGMPKSVAKDIVF